MIRHSNGLRAVTGSPVACLLGCVLAAAFTPAAMAQSTGQQSKMHCTVVGGTAMDPVPGREGVFLQASQAACTIEGGSADGAVQTLQLVWLLDKGKGTMLSNQGVIRKPGLLAMTSGDGTMTFQMADGRIAGWTASGKTRYQMASGSLAPYEGKSFSWTGRATSPRTYVLDVTPD
jgi:hypothetical protein